MTKRWTRVSKRTLFVWCLLGGLTCLLAPRSLTGRLQLAYMNAFSWPLRAGRDLSLATGGIAPLHAVKEPGDGIATAETKRLRNHIANLEAQLGEARREVDHLAGIRTEPQWERMAFLQAGIVSGQTQGALFINRGQNDGVAVDQYVLGDMSIIGTVVSVSTQSAKVKLITDRESKIPVTIGESDLARVMEGRSGNVAKIPLVQTTHTVRKGDKVYARKVPGLLDVPVIAAVIAECKRDPENPSLWDITVQPVCDVANLTSVAVILSTSQKQ